MSRSTYLKADTVALHSGYVPESDHGARAVPVYQTTSYVFESVSAGSSLFNVEQGGHIYSRITNPTVAVLEQRIAALEGGSGAICTASGMSALFTVFITLRIRRVRRLLTSGPLIALTFTAAIGPAGTVGPTTSTSWAWWTVAILSAPAPSLTSV